MILCESVLEHSLNVERACKSLILGDICDVHNKETFSDMWKYHDILEYNMPDITPHCWVSSEEKLKIELAVLNDLEEVLWTHWKYLLSLLKEYLEQKTDDSKLLKLLDNVDAWVKALEYEKMWFTKWVAKFHPYVLEKLHYNKKLQDIYQILLMREFTSFNYHFQYFRLLQFGWDYEKFRKQMLDLSKASIK